MTKATVFTKRDDKLVYYPTAGKSETQDIWMKHLLDLERVIRFGNYVIRADQVLYVLVED